VNDAVSVRGASVDGRKIEKIQGAYKLSEYFAKRDDRCILCNEIVHTTFGSTSQEDHDVQISAGTRVEPP
jgi:hypothetical protein